MTADRPASGDVDDELTRLLTYRHAAAAATERIGALTPLLDGLAPVLALTGEHSGKADEARDTLVDAIAAASTAQMMNQANFRAALGTLASPVQRSLLAFVG